MLQSNQFGRYQKVEEPVPDSPPFYPVEPKHDEDPVPIGRYIPSGAGPRFVVGNATPGFNGTRTHAFQKKLFPEMDDYKPGPMEVHPDKFGEHPDVVHHATFHNEPFARKREWGVHSGTRGAAEERMSSKYFDPSVMASSLLEEKAGIDYGNPDWHARKSQVEKVLRETRTPPGATVEETPVNMFKLILPQDRRAPDYVHDPGSGWDEQMKSKNQDEAHPYVNNYEDRGSTSYVAKPHVYMHPSEGILQANQLGTPVHPAWRGMAAAGHQDLPEKWFTDSAESFRDRRIERENGVQDKLPYASRTEWSDKTGRYETMFGEAPVSTYHVPANDPPLF